MCLCAEIGKKERSSTIDQDVRAVVTRTKGWITLGANRQARRNPIERLTVDDFKGDYPCRDLFENSKLAPTYFTSKGARSKQNLKKGIFGKGNPQLQVPSVLMRQE